MRRNSTIRAALCALLFLGCARTALAQSDEACRKQTVMLLVRSTGIAAIRAGFDSLRAHTSHVDYQTLAWHDAEMIRTALGLPLGCTPTSLKPFIPQHSAAIEDLREHMSPELFSHGAGIASAVNDHAELSQTESRIARWFVLEYAEPTPPSTMGRLLAKAREVELAEPKWIPATCYTPNDALYPQQYGPPLIHAPEAWDIVRCDSTIVVADVDVGTDWSHVDLEKSIFINKGEIGLDSNNLDKRSNGVDDDGNGFIDDWHGWDFGGTDGTIPDNDARPVASGHGTHTGGTIAATGDNKIGVAGIAFGARLIPLKGGNDEGSLDFVYEAIVYAADMGARAVNCSWGGPTRAQAEQDVVNFVSAKGMAVVAAAGNNHLYQEFYPASYHNVLSVGAIDFTGTIDAAYSNHSTRLAVCAPGTNILSTFPGDQYGLSTGTSMAAPHATGSLAVVIKRFPNYSIRRAMEQLRATCDTMTNNPFPDLTGRGRINLYRAVTETSAHSARIDSVEVLTASGDGTLNSGETGHIILHVTNYLAPVQNLIASIEILADPSIATSPTTALRFGAVNTMQQVQSSAVDFPVTVGTNAPQTSVLVKVTFSDAATGYLNDIDYFNFTVSPSYRDLNKNNLTVTFDSRGAIGYGDEQQDALGSGFYWRNPPSNISASGRNVAYATGLMVGTGAAHVVSNAPGPNTGVNDTDFTAVTPIFYQTPTDHANALQELISHYTDVNADTSAMVGIDVTERAYAFAYKLSANAVIVQYVVRKRAESITSDSASIALYSDWDIGISGSNNIAGFDSVDQLGWVARLDPNYPFVGTSLISPIPGGASLNFYAQNNDGSNGSVNSYDGLTRDEKWLMMTTPRLTSGPADVAITYGLKNVRLRSSDSIVMTLVLALATDRDALHQTIADARKAWFGGEAVAVTQPNTLRVFPNPATDLLHISLANSTATSIAMYDVLGRDVFHAVGVRGALDIPMHSLPSGLYTLVAVTGSLRSTMQIEHVR